MSRFAGVVGGFAKGLARGRRRVQLGAKREQQRLVGRERHAVRLPRVSPDLGHEPVLTLGAGLETALALNHLLHRLHAARLERRT
jgi:hypothetical protein